jgi:hypothetical protein
MCGHWISAPGSLRGGLKGDNWQSFTTMFSGTNFSMAGATATTFGGQPAWKMTQGPYALYVARSGNPYFLGAHTAQGQITFSQWNTAKVPGPPPASAIANIPTP